MYTKNYPEIVVSVAPNSNAYVITMQARNPEDAASVELTIGQIEAARNAAAATLETTGALVDSTASILSIPARGVKSTLTLAPSVVSLESSDAEEAEEETTSSDEPNAETVEEV